MDRAHLTGILLAAGESRRMGFPKPLLTIKGHTFLEHLSRAMLEAVPRLVIVVGAQAERVRQAVPRDPRISVVENPGYAQGQLSSLKIGLAEAGHECCCAMVHLADHPAVKSSTFRAMATAYGEAGKAITIARYQGRRGHPVIFDRSVFAEIMGAPLDEGARAVVNADPSRVAYVDLDDPGVVLDLDTPEDLARAMLPGSPGKSPATGS